MITTQPAQAKSNHPKRAICHAGRLRTRCGKWAAYSLTTSTKSSIKTSNVRANLYKALTSAIAIP